jgi:type I restriction enzyme S subunit
VIKIQNGYAFPSEDFREQGVPVIRQSNLGGDRVSLAKCVYIDESYLQSKSDLVLIKGDMLIGMSGSIGKLCVFDLDQPALQNQRTGKIVPHFDDALDRGYVFHFFSTLEKQLLQKGKGLGVANVSAADIHSLNFCLPPLAEQKRIVAQVESLLSRVTAARERLAKVPLLLSRVRQSVLAAACSGQLTADWREEHPDVEPAPELLAQVKSDVLDQLDKNRDISKYESMFAEFPPEPPSSDLPKSWLSCRVGHIGFVCNGSTPSRKRPEFWGNDINWDSFCMRV